MPKHVGTPVTLCLYKFAHYWSWIGSVQPDWTRHMMTSCIHYFPAGVTYYVDRPTSHHFPVDTPRSIDHLISSCRSMWIIVRWRYHRIKNLSHAWHAGASDKCRPWRADWQRHQRGLVMSGEKVTARGRGPAKRGANLKLSRAFDQWWPVGIDGQKGRGPTAWPTARGFGLAQTHHDPIGVGPVLARPDHWVVPPWFGGSTRHSTVQWSKKFKEEQ